LNAMEKDANMAIKTLKVDGGAVANNYLMQFQSDILGVQVERPEVIETTALGAAYLAGLAVGFYDKKNIKKNWLLDKKFSPEMPEEDRSKRSAKWQKAVERCMAWDLYGVSELGG